LLLKCCEIAIAPESLRNYYKIAPESLRKRCAIVVELPRGRLSVVVISVHNCRKNASQSLCSRFAVALQSFRKRFAVVAESMWNRCENSMVSLRNGSRLAVQLVVAITQQSVGSRSAVALHRYAAALQSLRNCCGIGRIRFTIAAESMWNRCENSVESFRNRCGITVQ
jgi:hypothetical protein